MFFSAYLGVAVSLQIILLFLRPSIIPALALCFIILFSFVYDSPDGTAFGIMGSTACSGHDGVLGYGLSAYGIDVIFLISGLFCSLERVLNIQKRVLHAIDIQFCMLLYVPDLLP